MLNKITKLALASLVSLSISTGCTKVDSGSKDDQILAKLEGIEKRLEGLEKRPAVGGPGAARPAGAPGAERKKAAPGVTYAIPVHESDPQRGAKHAKVTIVEAYEYACPYCSMAGEMLDGVLAKFPQDVKVVSKQFVVHPQIATDASLGACAAAKQGKFDKYDHAMWTKAWVKDASGRPSMVKEMLAMSALEKLAGDAGLDVNRFKADVAGDCKQMLERHRTEMATFGVTGTPAIFINGQTYTGQRTVEAMSAAVEAEIKKANDALAKGTKLEEYYASTVVKAGQKAL